MVSWKTGRYSMIHKDQNQESLFDEYAYDWWNKSGHYKLLHKINPIRLEYILSKCNLNGKSILDIGCGGGLLSEELSKKGANVTGIDSSKRSISIAKQHAKEKNLAIEYKNMSIFDLEEIECFDYVICFEMIEHINYPDMLIDKINKITKNQSMIFLSTINRNLKSFILAKIVAEYVLNYVPKGTHQYGKFITPYELTSLLEGYNFKVENIDGLSFNPLEESFSITKNTNINYFINAKKYI
jgi:2-polyprenyl-6-hydroxyphenyl methylase/3-demethylubiquinone-9 3-methyltransferase